MVKRNRKWIQDGFDVERLLMCLLCGVGAGIVFNTNVDLNRIAERLAIAATCVATVRSMMIPAVRRGDEDSDDNP